MLLRIPKRHIERKKILGTSEICKINPRQIPLGFLNIIALRKNITVQLKLSSCTFVLNFKYQIFQSDLRAQEKDKIIKFTRYLLSQILTIEKHKYLLHRGAFARATITYCLLRRKTVIAQLVFINKTV